MTIRPRRLELIDLVRELTQTTTHRERYERKIGKPRYHVTSNPPLLVQLEQAAFPDNARNEKTGAVRGSRPLASLDALDEHNRIHFQATTWLQDLGYNPAGTITDLVRRLGAVAAETDTPTRHAITANVRSWRSRIRVITGWDTPPWKPDNTCPACTTRGTLRIRFADKLAMCTHDTCTGTWDETTIHELANHIRAENGEDAA